MRRLGWWIYDRYWLAALWFHDARTPKAAKLYIKRLEEENVRMMERLWRYEDSNRV